MRELNEMPLSVMIGKPSAVCAIHADAPRAEPPADYLLTDAERRQLLVEWNDTAVAVPQDICIQQLFEAHVQRTPDAPALICGARCLTYAQLDARANQLARHLRTRGVGPDVLVALCVEPSIEIIVGILGILKAGGAYVPVDPAYPPERIAFLLADAQAPLILTQARLVADLPTHAAAVIRLDADWEHIAHTSDAPLARTASPDNLAYVIYTSGSTGNPKGVAITHRNLVHSTYARLLQYPDVAERFLMLSSFAFDSSVHGTFRALCQGGTLVLCATDDVHHPRALAQLIQSQQVTHLTCIPSLWALMMTEAAAGQLASLRTVIVGGETCSRALVEAHYALLADTPFFNEYGPTEATVWSHVYRCVPDDPHRLVPIGRPIANAKTYILDPDRRLVPVGVPGELYIGGPGVGRGYLRRPDLTAERFIPDPFSVNPDDRLYKTGDIVRYLPDGNVEFLGRGDHQVKIRGVRVELEEIEAALRMHPGVWEAVAMAREDIPGDQRLVGYVVSRGGALSPIELRRFLGERLPEYMVPSHFVMLDAMPLTPHGKVDRRALPPPSAARPDLAVAVTTGASATERRLVDIWEDVLNIRPVGTSDDFFALGGHSLRAMQLLARIEEHFGRRLPIATLFHAPTIAQLARLLAQPAWALPSSCVVPIQPEGSRMPFFCVHGADGSVVGFSALARELGTDQPFYGIQAHELAGARVSPETVEETAADYLTQLRATQPSGPYFLGGYSDGSTIAFEMARQLRAAGETVALLAMFDGWGPRYLTITWDARFARAFAANLPHAAREFLKRGPADICARIAMHARVLARVARNRAAIRFGHCDTPALQIGREYFFDNLSALPAERRGFAETHKRAMMAYRPRPYAGHVTLFRTRAQPMLCAHDAYLGWDGLVGGGFTVNVIPGKHETMLALPVVRDLAVGLRAALAAAHARSACQS